MKILTGGTVLFISLGYIFHACTAVDYGKPCDGSNGCLDGSFQECKNATCSCTDGYVENGAANGCNAELGKDCTNAVPCNDQSADCVGDTKICSCKDTHYDSNGSLDGGTCVLKTWSAWTNWGNCDVTCGDGSRKRSRTCPVGGGCQGLAEETKVCNTEVCPVDGNWGAWSQWTSCSPTCGDTSGTKRRTRSCNSPPPSNNGKNCAGDGFETQACSISKCPVNGGFSAWSDWATCSLSCAGGSQTRNRTCTNPRPQYGGAQCTGETFQSQPCNTHACPEIEYGQPCSTNGDKCKGDFTTCTSGTCQCLSGYYRNGNACLQKIELGSLGCSSTATDSCMSPYATCQTNGYCTCNTGYYDSNGNTPKGTCTKKIELGYTGCSRSVTDSCLSPYATCESNGGYCTCNTGYYDSNGNTVKGTCTKKIELGYTGCSRSVTDSCMSPYAACQSNRGYCTCNTGYYDSNGNTLKGTCTTKIELGYTGCSTTVTDSCLSPYATCQSNGGTCACNIGYYDSNGNTLKGTCKQISDPPSDFRTIDVTSRNISIRWDEPVNSYSDKIIGYIIQLKEKNICVEEIVYKCLIPSCRQTFEPSSLEQMCGRSVRKVVSLNKSQLNDVESYIFSKLLPDTTYTILGAAVNYKGVGNTADLTITTKEEAPQRPYNVLVKDIKTSSMSVTWNIAEPRPGKTNYTVTLTSDRPAESQEFIVIGFTSRAYSAQSLEEYWYYSVTVTATTSKGSKTSYKTGKYRTLPTAPGKVSNFVITPNPGGNYTQMKISWQAPDILEQNSVIKSYSFMYFPEQNFESAIVKTFDHQFSQSFYYETIVSVIPEKSYTFEVFAINDQNMTGEKYIETRIAPAAEPSAEKSDSQTATVIVGVVLGAIIIVVSIYAVYTTLVIRRYKNKEDEHEICKHLKSKGPIYVNESFTTGVAKTGEQPSGTSDYEATAENAEYLRLDESTRDDKETYDSIKML